jgi:vacuolar protein sorting-associated protein IST1
MFSSGPNYNKLKTNLRLAVNRLKLLEKKKTETNQKARKEIAGIYDLVNFNSTTYHVLF